MPVIASLAGITPWAALVSETAAYVSECPRPIIEQALRDACREFFSTSKCWRERGLTLVTTVASQAAYTFNPPANAELMEVISAWDDDEEVDVGLPGEEDDFYPAETDSEYRITVSDDGTRIELSPLPLTAGVVLKGGVIYTLARNATGIPTWVYNEHNYGITCGAAARLVMQPRKPWTDREAYPMHRSSFMSAVNDASNKAGPAMRRPLRTKPV
jgi:hypothetical protein